MPDVSTLQGSYSKGLLEVPHPSQSWGKKHSRTTSSLLKAPAAAKQVSLLAAVTTQARESAGSGQQNFGGFV